MRYLVIAVMLALAACSSEAPSDRDERGEAGPGRAPEPAGGGEGGPEIRVSSAPGVAFSYEYVFAVADARIAAVQEGHAQACERIGVERCRITGMEYHVHGDGSISASLDFKLDPALARAFGQNGIKAVLAAKGTLTDARITGKDVGTEIDDARHRQVEARGDIATAERRLAAAKGDAERAAILAELARLREAARGDAEVRRAGETRLAATPVRFDYSAGQRSRLADAAAEMGDNLESSAAAIVILFSVLLPFALVIGLAVALFAFVRRRWFQQD